MSEAGVNMNTDITIQTNDSIFNKYIVAFSNESGIVGGLIINNGRLDFEGNASESAEIFFREFIEKNEIFIQGIMDSRNSDK